jgi:hypothetical protein
VTRAVNASGCAGDEEGTISAPPTSGASGT